MSSESSIPTPAKEPATADAVTSPNQEPKQPESPKGKRKLIIVAVVVLVLLAVTVPRVLHALRTVSTDDAYVNSYVTFVAPRVIGQVARVLVDDNNRVKKGDVLLELDAEPYRVQAAIKKAAVDAAQAELVVAQA